MCPPFSSGNTSLQLLVDFPKAWEPIQPTMGVYEEVQTHHTAESIQYLLSFVSRFSLCVQNISLSQEETGNNKYTATQISE